MLGAVGEYDSGSSQPGGVKGLLIVGGVIVAKVEFEFRLHYLYTTKILFKDLSFINKYLNYITWSQKNNFALFARSHTLICTLLLSVLISSVRIALFPTQIHKPIVFHLLVVYSKVVELFLINLSLYTKCSINKHFKRSKSFKNILFCNKIPSTLAARKRIVLDLFFSNRENVQPANRLIVEDVQCSNMKESVSKQRMKKK